MTTADSTTNRPIYIGSLWHEFCDPFVTVAGYGRDTVKAKLHEIAEEEFARLVNDDVPEEEINIMTGGIFTETSLDDFLFDDREFRLGELEEDGITIF